MSGFPKGYMGIIEGLCGPLSSRYVIEMHMGGCQNYGPFLDPYYNTAPNI